ncbi:MAG: PEP-CTERM sorting domain-containing protein [Pseudomonadota bacterium]
MRKFLSLAAVLALFATEAPATTYIWDLVDHPDRAIQSEDYGLRLDRESPDAFWSMNSGAAVAKLTYDSAAGTAEITGTMLGDGGGLWDISYTLTGITDLTNGFFYARRGSGSISEQGGPGFENLVGKGKGCGFRCRYQFAFVSDTYNFDDQARPTSNGGITGSGWIRGHGTNDFLFSANTPPSIVPVPGSLLMLLSALLGFGFMTRKRSA